MKYHSLINTLINLRDNARGCVYTEPLWGIPYNLYIPYASVFMVALGLSDQQIGLIVSITWGVQIFMTMLSGMVIDKLGRRRTTLIFGILAWSVPALISAVAQNFWYFLVAGLVNTTWRIIYSSWSCLLVEDTDPDQLVDIYTWIYIAEQATGFVAPLAGALVGAFGRVPAMRGLYFFAAFMFTVKFMVTYWMTEESSQGLARMRETHRQSVLSVLGEYKDVLQVVLRSPQMLYVAAILLTTQITWVIGSNFWPIIVTQKLLISDQNLATFTFVRSAIMLVFFFVVMPWVNKLHFRLPLVLGFLGYIASKLLLIAAPSQGYFMLTLSVFLEACSFAVVGPLVDKLTAMAIDAKERARILAIMYVVIILITAPFGWIAGTISEIDKGFPFILCIVLYAISAGLAYRIGTASQEQAVPA